MKTYLSLLLFIGLPYFLPAQIPSKIHRSSISSVYIQQQGPFIHPNVVINLGTETQAHLQFDDLELQFPSYYLRILHCGEDWKLSNLAEIEYLSDFNDQALRNPTNSVGTKVPYQHYSVAIPALRVSGNYIAMVYHKRNKQDTLFTLRFSVAEKSIQIPTDYSYAKTNQLRNTRQNIDFKLLLSPQLIYSGEENIKIHVRQNHQEKNVIPKLPASQFNSFDNSLSFPFFGQENAVPGTNEFRMIDLRSSQQKLSFVDHMEANDIQNHLYTLVEKPQGLYPYSQRNDMNGDFVIESYENRENPLQADYVACTFRLQTNPSDEAIYLVGGFNNYVQNESSLLRLNPSTGFLETTQILKQGIYNYQFKSKNPSNTTLEGNYSQTENLYEILVYYQKPGTRYDSLIGYTSFVSGQ